MGPDKAEGQIYTSIPPLFRNNSKAQLSDFVPDYDLMPYNYKIVLYNTFPLLIWYCKHFHPRL